jgi:hypothetical protein
MQINSGLEDLDLRDRKVHRKEVEPEKIKK